MDQKGSFFYHGVKLPKVTELSIFAEDTLPLNARTYELPRITIYTINYAEYAYLNGPYNFLIPAAIIDLVGAPNLYEVPLVDSLI